jgi:hypothetical protein
MLWTLSLREPWSGAAHESWYPIREEGFCMLSLRIEGWNQPAYTTASEPTPDTNKVFDQFIEDQEMVAELEQQFNGLPRGTHGGSVMTHGYRYQFTFFHDRVVTQTYAGVSFSNT